MAPYLGKWKSAVVLPLAIDPISPCTTPRVYQHLLSSEEWVNDIHAADVIFVSAHSQGSIVSTHLVDRLIRDGYVTTPASTTEEATRQTGNTTVESADGVWVSASEHSAKGSQRICCLSLCGVHLGPLRYLKMNSYIQPYIQVGDIHPAQCFGLWLITLPT